MQPLLITILLILITAFSSAVTAAPKIIPKAPAVAANAYIVVDHHSGQILASKNPDQQVEPASITKIMTAYVVFNEIREGNITLEDEVTVSEKAWRAPGSRMFIEVNKQVPVEKLLKGMIVQSGNDASIALAEHVAGSEDAFAALMNQHAVKLGMNNTNFVNSTGLPHEEHLTTASDLAALSRALIRDYPEYYEWYSIKEYTYNNIKQHNRNNLLWRDKTVDGIKTGHTESAGYCLVTSAKRDEMRLITVVLGTKSKSARIKESQKLLNYAFRFFETHKLYTAYQPLQNIRVYMGESEQLPVGITEDLYVTVPRGQYNSLKPALAVNPKLEAPINKGSSYGEVTVSLEDKVITSVPLIALKDIAEGGFWQQASDGLELWWND